VGRDVTEKIATCFFSSISRCAEEKAEQNQDRILHGV